MLVVFFVGVFSPAVGVLIYDRQYVCDGNGGGVRWGEWWRWLLALGAGSQQNIIHNEVYGVCVRSLLGLQAKHELRHTSQWSRLDLVYDTTTLNILLWHIIRFMLCVCVG